MLDLDELSREYLSLRTKRELLKEKFESEDQIMADAMAEIENTMLGALNDTNSGSISTNSAVIMRGVRNRYNPTNWDAVYKLVDKHKAYGLLEKRVHNGNMKQFLEEHPDEFPAGLNVDSRYTITVRRKNQGE